MKKSHFYMILSNGLIALMLCSLCVLTFVDPVKSVVMQDTVKVFYNGNTENNNVTLMFNVYWGNEYIDSILETLKSYDIKTTFFVGGIWAEKYSDILQKIVADGHELGNHGYLHKSQDKLDYQQNQDEILNNHKLIKSLTGIEMNLFAPPSGAFSDTTLQVAKNLGYSTIMWTRDTIDWRDQNEELIYTRATKQLKGGDLILMHPTKATSQALDRIVQYVLSQNLKIVPVSENIK